MLVNPNTTTTFNNYLAFLSQAIIIGIKPKYFPYEFRVVQAYFNSCINKLGGYQMIRIPFFFQAKLALRKPQVMICNL